MPALAEEVTAVFGNGHINTTLRRSETDAITHDDHEVEPSETIYSTFDLFRLSQLDPNQGIPGTTFALFRVPAIEVVSDKSRFSYVSTWTQDTNITTGNNWMVYAPSDSFRDGGTNNDNERKYNPYFLISAYPD